MQPLEFWFDFASTYSYIGAMRIEALCAEAAVPLRWRPFLLGPIFALQGWNDSPFMLNDRRGAYMWRDLERLTSKFGFPWRKPSVFPRNSVLPARIAAAYEEQSWLPAFIRATFIANFGEDRDIGDEGVVRDILSSIGQNADEVFGHTFAPEHRGRIRSNTEHAIALGIFGAPNCLVDGELFWGEETLEDALGWANGPMPLPHN